MRNTSHGSFSLAILQFSLRNGSVHNRVIDDTYWYQILHVPLDFVERAGGPTAARERTSGNCFLQCAASGQPERARHTRCSGGYVHRPALTTSPGLAPQPCACSPAGGALQASGGGSHAVTTHVQRGVAVWHRRTPSSCCGLMQQQARGE